MARMVHKFKGVEKQFHFRCFACKLSDKNEHKTLFGLTMWPIVWWFDKAADSTPAKVSLSVQINAI